jgi:hypothetical protein
MCKWCWLLLCISARRIATSRWSDVWKRRSDGMHTFPHSLRLSLFFLSLNVRPMLSCDRARIFLFSALCAPVLYCFCWWETPEIIVKQCRSKGNDGTPW